MPYPINVLKEALHGLRYIPKNETRKEWQRRNRWKQELIEAIEVLDGKQLELRLEIKNDTV